MVKRVILLVLILVWGWVQPLKAQGIISVLSPPAAKEKQVQTKSLFEKSLETPLSQKPKIFPSSLVPKKPKKVFSAPHPKIPAQERRKSQPLSPIEKLFATRAKTYGITLRQFGYEFFRFSKASAEVFSVPVPHNYVLGPGDELILYVIGSPPGLDLAAFSRLEVDREGKIYLPGLGVFYVWGKTLAQTEKLLSSKLKANLRLSLGRLRHFPVYVSGEVKFPGSVAVSGADTVIEALSRAGGVKKTGSLRRIVLTRQEAASKTPKRIPVDLYQLLIEGKPLNLHLRDGDVILVPPLKGIAAVGGEIRRPGIYEFLPGETLADLINLAGGLLPSSYRYRIILERYQGNERLTVKELALDFKAFQKIPLKDGDLLVIKKVLPEPENKIEVKGHTPYPGLYEYQPGLTLRAFLTRDFFYQDTNLWSALLERHPKGAPPEFITFNPAKVLAGEFDLPLKSGDVIRLFPAEFYQPVRLTGCVEPGYVPFHKGLTLREALANKKFCQEIKGLKAEIYRSSPKGLSRVKTIYLAKLLIKNQKGLNLLLKPGDLVLIKEVEPEEVVEKVTIVGYVKRPGAYALRPGLRLYDLLKEAGGFRPKAYPEGIVIIRESVAAMQRKRLQRALVELQKSLAKEEAGILQAELSPAEKEARHQAFEARRRLLAAMEKIEVTGRLTGLHIPHNLEKLKDSPSNILLEDGDRIFVPKEPANVLIFGEVNNPSALLYRQGLTVEDYINLAGGFTKYADVKEIFVIRANGEATAGGGKVEALFWDAKGKRFVRGRFGHILAYQPRPGEAIIVPTKIKIPIMWRPLIRDVIQIIYQSALTVFTITNL